MPAVITEDKAFAYNETRGHPWHRLGKGIAHDMTQEEALVASGSNDTVEPRTIFVLGDDGQPEEVEGKIAIYSDKYGAMGIASPDYEITQRSELLQIAYEIEGLSKGAAHIDTIGNLGAHGERFFFYLRVPDLVIDPNGIADTLERGVAGATSFDGSYANMLWDSVIRPVCQNTLTAAIAQGKNFVKARHTKDSEARMKVAAAALGKVGAVDAEMTRKAEAMLRVDGDKALKVVLDAMWDVSDPDLPHTTRARREGERMQVRNLYNGPHNISASKVGENGWAVYQAATEFFDHKRSTRNDDGTRRAVGAVMPGKVMNEKALVAGKILALA
jgi:phage/plasmid-like protein (TIGR03299 family)